MTRPPPPDVASTGLSPSATGVRPRKTVYFVLEGLNSFGSNFYFYYLFFYMHERFAFGNRENLTLAALNGFIYMFAAWFTGRFGQRFGYARALQIGFFVMAAGMIAGLFARSAPTQVVVLIIWTIGNCFTWPNLEALASEGEDPDGLKQKVGLYNVVWAGTGAISYFIGGALLERLGLECLFWLPLIIYLLEAALLAWTQTVPRAALPLAAFPSSDNPVELNPRPIARTRAFLRMAWLANPFAYVAINTVVAVVPELALQLRLGPALAGVFCSVWFFARLGTFVLLWQWAGWHYRFGWFHSAYVLLITSFAVILLFPKLLVVLIAQVAFGYAVGLIYYSSLYYSMNVGEAKGEHGGMHEAAIGAGIFVGPGLGAAALHWRPDHPDSGTWAVSLALCAGMLALLVVSRLRR